MTSQHIAKVFHAALHPKIEDEFTALENRINRRMLFLKRSFAAQLGWLKRKS